MSSTTLPEVSQELSAGLLFWRKSCTPSQPLSARDLLSSLHGQEGPPQERSSFGGLGGGQGLPCWELEVEGIRCGGLGFGEGFPWDVLKEEDMNVDKTGTQEDSEDSGGMMEDSEDMIEDRAGGEEDGEDRAGGDEDREEKIEDRTGGQEVSEDFLEDLRVHQRLEEVYLAKSLTAQVRRRVSWGQVGDRPSLFLLHLLYKIHQFFNPQL